MSRNLFYAMLLALFLPVPSAYGHPDYERPVTTVKGARGEALLVVRHYRDGIVGRDPVKLVVYDTVGRTVAETPYSRGIVTLETADGLLYVFAVHMNALSFWEGWVLDGGELVPVPAADTVWLALLVNLGAHWLAYWFSALLCWTAGLAHLSRPKRGQWPDWLVLLAFVWLMLCFIYGNLSLLLILGLAFFGLLPFLWRNARARYRSREQER